MPVVRSANRKVFGFEGGGDTSPLNGRFVSLTWVIHMILLRVIRPDFEAEVEVTTPTEVVEYCTDLVRGTEALGIIVSELDVVSDLSATN